MASMNECTRIPTAIDNDDGHQWLHREHPDGDITVSIREMTAVLQCAASLADKEGMLHTARRLRNDARRVGELFDGNGRNLTIHVQ